MVAAAGLKNDNTEVIVEDALWQLKVALAVVVVVPMAIMGWLELG